MGALTRILIGVQALCGYCVDDRGLALGAMMEGILQIYWKKRRGQGTIDLTDPTFT